MESRMEDSVSSGKVSAMTGISDSEHVTFSLSALFVSVNGSFSAIFKSDNFVCSCNLHEPSS